MNEPDITLSDTQLSIMQVLWELGEADTQTVCDALAAQGRQLAYTTVATLLKRLEKRGVVDHRLDGRKQVFRARVSEAEVRSSMVAGLVGSLFRGDPRALVSHLVREREVGPDDLEELRKLLARGERT